MRDHILIAGIDGGGTKTVAAASSVDGTLIAQVTGQSINYNAVGMDTARRRLAQIMERLCAACNCQCFHSVFIGTSALYCEATNEELRTFTDGIVPAKKVMMDSDLYIALEGMNKKGPAVLAISGTGSMVISRDENGHLHQTGGWGYILGDEGSAYHIAVSALRYALRAADAAVPKSNLQQAVLDYYRVENHRQLIDIFYDPEMERAKIAEFAREVYRCANGGDGAARRILLREAGYMAENTLVHLRRSCREDIPVGIYGGVFINNTIFRQEFENLIHARYPGTVIESLRFPPQIGALFCCLKNEGLSVSDIFIKNVQNSYSNVAGGIR